MNRTAGVAAALAAAALIAGCSTTINGAPTANPAAKQAHVECVRATNDAVGTAKSWLSSIDTFQKPQLDTTPFRNMRTACNSEFVAAYSDFLARVEGEFVPVTIIGRAAIRQLMNEMCRNDFVVDVKIDQLTEDAQKACRGT